MKQNSPRYHVVNVRPKHQVKELIDELMDLMDEETKVRPSSGDALSQALREAIAVRKERARLRSEHNRRSA